ncbi:hypothetical protein Pint_36736 [Pistacia integerrima]|nr:hypothetical protein Pint_36736 [Pistacia integerrima]
MILIFYITHKVISLHGENQIGSRNDITPDWSHGWNNFDQMLMQDSKPLLLSNLRTTKMNDDVLAIAISPDAKYIAAALLDCIVKKDIMQMFGVLRSATVVILLSQDLMSDLYVIGIWSPENAEEKEKRLEEMFESDLDNATENKYAPKEELLEEGAVALAGKKTQETLTKNRFDY